MLTWQFEDPAWLTALWLTPIAALLAWFSAAVASRRRRLSCAVLRTVMVAAVALALARPSAERVETRGDAPVVLALTDVSESAGGEPAEAFDLWKRCQAAADVVFEVAEFANVASFLDAPETLDPTITNLETSVDQAVARLGANPNGHILLFTDGRATRGQALSAAARAVEAGLRVHTIPIGDKRRTDPRIVGVTPPEDARAGVTGHAFANIRTDEPTQVELAVVSNDGLEISRRETRVAGDVVVGLPLTPSCKGLHDWSIVLSEKGDAKRRLDVADLGFDVKGPPAVLLCDPAPLSLAPLQQVLRNLRFDQRVITPAEFPQTFEELRAYDAIAVSDCPRPDFGDDQLDLLEEYVRRGGGLIFIGGSRVSTKAWRGSRLEELLPVDFARAPVREEQKLKPVHVCYVLDASGSMSETLGGTASTLVSKFAMTKAAVAASLDVLPETALVSVIVFDFGYDKVLSAVPIARMESIKRRVAELGVGGGTNMVPAMVEAVQTLIRTDMAGHMIVLTDGISSEDPPAKLLEWIASADISLTAVAVGAGANTVLMEHMAKATRGVYHFCSDATSIPLVFVREAEHISTLAALETDPIQPRPGPHPDFLHGLGKAGWPQLESALAAKPKFAASVETPLEDEQGRPLLARWKVGLGDVTAYLSDAKPTWARQWMQWDDFARFWARIFTAGLSSVEPLQAVSDVRLDGDRCVVLLSVFDETGRQPDDVSPTGQLLAESDSDRFAVPLQWRRLSSGVFEGRAAVEAGERYVGEYVVRGSSGVVELSRRFLISGPRVTETLETGPDERALRALAAAGDGLYAPTPSQLAAAINERRTIAAAVVQPYWQWLLMLALILWPLDTAVRRFGEST